MFYIEYL